MLTSFAVTLVVELKKKKFVVELPEKLILNANVGQEQMRTEWLVNRAIHGGLPLVIEQFMGVDGDPLRAEIAKIPTRNWTKAHMELLGNAGNEVKTSNEPVYRALINACSAVSALIHKGKLTDAAANAAYVVVDCPAAAAEAFQWLQTAKDL